MPPAMDVLQNSMYSSRYTEYNIRPGQSNRLEGTATYFGYFQGGTLPFFFFFPSPFLRLGAGPFRPSTIHLPPLLLLDRRSHILVTLTPMQSFSEQLNFCDQTRVSRHLFAGLLACLLAYLALGTLISCRGWLLMG